MPRYHILPPAPRDQRTNEQQEEKPRQRRKAACRLGRATRAVGGWLGMCWGGGGGEADAAEEEDREPLLEKPRAAAAAAFVPRHAAASFLRTATARRTMGRTRSCEKAARVCLTRRGTWGSRAPSLVELFCFHAPLQEGGCRTQLEVG